jgi:hypothetical protein
MIDSACWSSIKKWSRPSQPLGDLSGQFQASHQVPKTVPAAGIHDKKHLFDLLNQTALMNMGIDLPSNPVVLSRGQRHGGGRMAGSDFRVHRTAHS